MWKLVAVIGLCLVGLSAFCQSTPKYQVATILEVKPRAESGTSAADATSYDVSVKVGDTIYVVLYAPHVGESDPKYVAGRELLVLVGKQTITYNDILGQSFVVPIQSQKPASSAKHASR
jgi:hypothetical protein